MKNQKNIIVKEFLQQHGVVHLPNALDKSRLKTIAAAANDCFTDIENLILQHGANRVKDYLPVTYEYFERATSFSLVALDDFQNAQENMVDIFKNSLGMSLVIELLGQEIVCNLSKSRVTKQFALDRYHALHTANSWHQDGALKVTFPMRDSLTNPPYFNAEMTEMVICWIPLVDCLGDCPCLQLIRKPLDSLLHFDFLNDRELEKIFAPDDFWVPKLKFGDILILDKGTLHRTFVTESMKKNRTSIELRFMIPQKIPQNLQNDKYLPIIT